MGTTDKSCVLLLDVPSKSLGGIDLLSFTTSPQFKGVKNVPRGWHFVFCASSSALSVRHGAWFFVKGQSSTIEMFAFTWNSNEEKLAPISEDTRLMQYRANLGQIWKEGLTPYRQTSGRDGDTDDEEEIRGWRNLTDCITPALLNRILGSSDGEPSSWTLTSASSAKIDADDIPNLHIAGTAQSGQQEEIELNFLPIDLKRTWRPGATGRERTDAARDHSWYLLSLISDHCGSREEEVVGELQFCFLMVLVLNNFSCLEQWKRILSLVFTSFEAVKQRERLFVKVIRMVALQMKHIGDAEGGLFDISDVDGNFLKQLLRKFKLGMGYLEDGLGKMDVSEELEQLQAFFKSEFGWEVEEGYVLRHGMMQLEDGEMVQVDVHDRERDEEDEEGEYAPTVVELTDEQLKSLGGGSGGRPAEPEEQMREELEEDRTLEDELVGGFT